MEPHPNKDGPAFLKAVLGAWPKGTSVMSLDLNAAAVGQKLGFDELRTRNAVDSLVVRGLLHSRDVEGVRLIHPTEQAFLIKVRSSGNANRIRKSVSDALRFFWPFGRKGKKRAY
jgi:hypothetical protein